MHGTPRARFVQASTVLLLYAGCGGASGGGTRPTPPALDQDYSASFVGNWMGAAITQIGAEPETVYLTQTIVRDGENLLVLKDFCTRGVDAWGVVTGPTTFMIPPMSCRMAANCGAVTMTVTEGTGERAHGQLTIRAHGSATGCGQQIAYALSFTGNTTLPPTPIIRYGPASVTPGQSVTLDGSESFDVLGSVQYSWAVISSPDGATPSLGGASSSLATFSSTTPGPYVLQLTVTGPDGQTATTTASIHVTDWVDYGPPQLHTVQQGVWTGVPGEVRINAYDPNGMPLRYAWSLIDGPPGPSAVLAGGDTATPTLTAYSDGDYQLRVVVTNFLGESSSATVMVVASTKLALRGLPHHVVHAQYSRSLDRIVMTDPSGGLWMYDPSSTNEVTVSLGSAPSCLSLSQDGRRALVGHEGSLSLVDLTTATATSITVSVTPGACALGDGWAYLFPATGTTIDSVEIRTGTEHLAGAAGDPYHGPALSPDGRTLYAIQNHNYLTAWDIRAGTAQQIGVPVFAGSSLRSLWLDRDGARLFSTASSVYGVSVGQEVSLQFLGSFQDISWIEHLDVSTTEIAAVQGTEFPPPGITRGTGRVELFDATTLTLRRKISLPLWLRDDGYAFGAYGRYVFYSSDGTKKYVLVEADASSGFQDNIAVLTY